jgi:DNA repair protein RadC
MSTLQSLVPFDHAHVLTLLHEFFGERAATLYEAHGRSVAKLVAEARGSKETDMRLLSHAVAIAEAAAIEAAAERDTMESPDAATRFLKLRFAGQEHESFIVLYLDVQHRLLAAEELFRGTLSQTSVYPREVVKRALHHNAGAVILSHCHPSGVSEPSKADELLTRALKHALDVIDVHVLDHIVVAGGGHISFAQRGLI